MRLVSDRPALRIGGFVAVLAVLFGAAFGVGRMVDDEEPAESAGYELRLASAEVQDSRQAPVRFTIRDAAGETVTRFAVRHEKRLHLIVVRDNFDGFQHVHPTMAADGTWSTTLATFSGEYRVFADFQEEGADESVAYADLHSTGNGDGGFTSVPPPVARSVQVGAYEVSLAGDLTPGAGSTMTLTVTKNGRAVTDLQPYLGAYGHLVVLRGADKQYLHAHPEEGPAGPEIAFHVEVPTQDRYYLYLDFKHGGTVRTAQFALDAVDAPTTGDGGGHGGH